MQLVLFALDGWTQTEAVPFYAAPNSWFGRALGVILGYGLSSLDSVDLPDAHLPHDARLWTEI